MCTYMPGGHAGRLDYARLFAAVAILLTGITGTGYAESPSAPATAESPRLDRSHRYLSDRVLHLAESINNVISSTFRQEEDHESEMIRRFFGNLLTAYQVEGSHIRVTPRLILTEENGNEYKVDFSARLRLPDLSRRLRLYVDSYDTDYDTMEDIFSTRYRQRLDLERGEGTTAGQTYFFSDHMKRDLSLSTGLKFRPEPSPKIRLRGRVRKSFDIWRAEVAQSGFWSEKDGVGERTEFTLDRPSGEIHLVRLRSSVVWSELSHGVDWGQFAPTTLISAHAAVPPSSWAFTAIRTRPGLPTSTLSGLPTVSACIATGCSWRSSRAWISSVRTISRSHRSSTSSSKSSSVRSSRYETEAGFYPIATGRCIR